MLQGLRELFGTLGLDNPQLSRGEWLHNLHMNTVAFLESRA
jgi:hypothetical protein